MVMNIAAWRWQAGEDLLAALLLGAEGCCWWEEEEMMMTMTMTVMRLEGRDDLLIC